MTMADKCSLGAFPVKTYVPEAWIVDLRQS